MTAMTKATESLPPAFAAVIVYVAEALIPVGVPLIAPVDVSNESPTGSVGDTDQDVIVPPFAVGVIVVMVTFLVSVTVVTP